MFEKYTKQITLAAIALLLLLIICHVSKATNTNLLGWVDGFNPNPTTTSPSYCPGTHPKVPCSMIRTCPTASSKLSSENQEIVDRYIYLKSLLESTKLLNDKEHKWELI
jgi:hypothetical protein